MPPTTTLAGRTALITGGTRGIGLAIARQILASGGKAMVIGRKQEALDEALTELSDYGGAVYGATANVGSADDRARIVEATVAHFGGFDVLVNNAAANPVYGKLEDTEPWAFAKIIEVNLAAPFELARLALPHLAAYTRSDIVNVSSIGGLRPEPGLGIYSVSKAALNSLTQVMAKEWGPRGVHAHAICPGLIKTDFSQALWNDPRTAGHLTRNTPLQRIGDPDDIGALVAALLGPAGAYVSGHILTADGGYTI